MPVKPGLATGLSKGLAFFEDVYMSRLRAKLEDQMAEKNASRKHFMDIDEANAKADREKADAADVNKQTEKANADAIARQKAAFDADVDNDQSLDAAVKSRAKALSSLGTPEGLTRAQSLVDSARKTAATPVKVDKVEEYKQKIADMGGWDEAAKTNPGLIKQAEVWGVTRKTEKGPSTGSGRTAAGDKPPGAQQLIKDALSHVTGQEKSAAAIAAKIIADPDNTSTPEEAKATAQQIMGLDPDKRKAAITYLKTEGKMRNAPVADSLIADWSQPGDFEDTTTVVDPADLEKTTGLPLSGTAKPAASSTAVTTGAPVLGPKPTPGAAAMPAAPAAGQVSPEDEAKRKEQAARVDRILRELEQEMGIAP
jgi:hypothetical protein